VFSTSLLKCLSRPQAKYVLAELDWEICGIHSRARCTTTRVIRVRYYLPRVKEDALKCIMMCEECQNFGRLHIRPLEELPMVTPCHSRPGPWIYSPFPFSQRSGKILIVYIDYFTKWIEVEPQPLSLFIWFKTFSKKNCVSALSSFLSYR